MSRQDKELRDRWSADSADTAMELLLRGQAESPFGSYEGRVDMRGLTVEQPARTAVGSNLSRIAKIFKFEQRRIDGVDFSYASLPEWRVNDTRFDNCVFDHAKLISFRSYSAVFERCTFRSTKLNDAVLGATSNDRRPGGVFQDCDFSGADLRGASTDPGRFVRCDFQASKWKGTRFLSTVLEYCDFRGASIDGAFFDGRAFSNNAPVGLGENKLTGCNFSSTALSDTSFMAIDFRNCVPPAGPDFVLIDEYPRTVQAALDYVRSSAGRDATIAAAILEPEASSAKFLPTDARGLLQLNHYPGGSRTLITQAFGVPND